MKMMKSVVSAFLLISTFASTVLAQTEPSIERFTGNITRVAPSSEFAGALTALSLKLNTLGDAYSNAKTLNFPVAIADIDLSNAKGEIWHTGGLRLTKGTTVVDLRGFIIDTTGATPGLTGLVSLNGALVGRVRIFDLTLPSITLPIAKPKGNRRLAISRVQVKLSSVAAQTLNVAFATEAFTAGFNIGTAGVILRPERIRVR